MLMKTGDVAPASGKARTLTKDPRALRLYHGLIAASVLLPLLIFAFAAWQNWQQLERLAGERAERRAALMAEHALKVFQGNEQILRRIGERAGGLTWDGVAASAELNAFLDSLHKEVDHLQGAGLIRPYGRLANVNAIFPAPPTDLSDRDYSQAARREPGRTYLLFTDVVLAGALNGRKLADEALRQRPELKVVFTTGYTRNAIIHHGRLDEGVNFLGKPFTARDVYEKIRTVLAG
jgi:hypothetical protein